MKKTTIAIFIGYPVILILSINLLAPLFSNAQILGLELGEPYLKHEMFIKRPLVDTVICGDSRVRTITPDAFLKRSWAPFNWGLAGVDPGDFAMTVKYSLIHGKIRRMIIGVSFESMAEKSPFMTSRYLDIFPFTDPRIEEIWGANNEHSTYQKLFYFKKYLGTFWDRTKAIVRSRYEYLIYKYITPQDQSEVVCPYGNIDYPKIRRGIKDGTFVVGDRDPSAYFNREDGEAGYLKNKVLSAQAQQIYIQVFKELRSRKIPTVVYETARTANYQHLIDQDPLLKQLNEQWREFFRKESYGGIKFIEARELTSCYYLDDFFDSLHFLGGKTDKALSEKLASELEKLENSTNAF